MTVDWQMANQLDDCMQANRRLEGKVVMLKKVIEDMKSLMEVVDNELYYAKEMLSNCIDCRQSEAGAVSVMVLSAMMERLKGSYKHGN